MKALAPARVREVRIHPDTGTAEVIVPDFQLSLAIGKEGQNARLAARLTGWRVDIKSETQLAEEESGGGVEYAEGEWVENDVGRAGLATRRGRRGDLGGRGRLRRAVAGGRPAGARSRGGRRRRQRDDAAADAPAAEADADAAVAGRDARRSPPTEAADGRHESSEADVSRAAEEESSEES